MPTYVYKDLGTGETFEVVQSINDTALKQHPETGSPVKRVIQPVGIAFKGPGFYVTDSRKSESNINKDSGKTESNKGSSSKESKESNASTKVETKEKSAKKTSK